MSTAEERLRMAASIVDFEARRDKQGRLQIYKLPPEDGGGIPGFYELLEAIADPAHPNHAHLKELAGDYDPTTFDTLPIKYALSRIANRRNSASTRLSKKKHLGLAA